MKKIIIYFLFCSISLIKIQAQVNKAFNITEQALNEVTFYEQPNYRGNQGKVFYGKGGMRFPFANKKNVSFTIASGKIVYIKFCNEIPYEQAYSDAVPNIDLSMICGIRIDETQNITLAWSGISSEIHNNDCKKVFGKITVKFKEIAPDGTESFLQLQQVIPTNDKFTFEAFNKTNADVPNRYGNFVYNNNPLPNVINAVSIQPNGRDECWLLIGKTAIRDGRVRMVITSNIRSEHKGGDLELDYSNNIHMASPVTEQIPINYLYNGDKLVNAENPRFFVGPYRASGGPQNRNIASGGIYKNFRSYFIISGL